MTVPITPTTTLIGETLGLVFTIASAREDATPAQLNDLRALVPELRMFKLSRDDTRIRAKLRDIMGDSWRPSSEWQAGIDDPLGRIGQELLKRGVSAKDVFG
jgi:hypothetical protein